MDTIPSRNLNLPLFDPHRPEFTCVHEATQVPPIDPQAEIWFQQAMALDDPYKWSSDRDYPQIVSLYQQAADRQHWKAMMNLVSLQLQGLGLPKDREAAVQRVEAAMKLGIPAAYDRMGVFYQNSIGMNGDATRAYAFFQKAADMGSPDAQTYIGSQLLGVRDNLERGWWGNRAIGIKMLECAFAQGHGQAAYKLGLTTRKTGNKEANARSLHYFHEGVKMGHADSAAYLAIEFGDPDFADTINPGGVDQAREDRYWVFHNALDFNPLLRFPNLDAVLPLPPARLPKWNGNKDDLLNAAKVVVMEPAPHAPQASTLPGRYYLAPTHDLVRRPDYFPTAQATAPYDGWFRPYKAESSAALRQFGGDFKHVSERMPPGYYRAGEPFQTFFHATHKLVPIDGVHWECWGTVKLGPPYVDPRARNGQWREIARVNTIMRRGDEPCPTTGIWDPFLDKGHPLRALVNIGERRQVWLQQGQAFPDPRQHWLLDIAPEAVSWYLMDAKGIDILQDHQA